MKLLLITQTVDRNDLYLGFFHTWIIELAKHIERIEVVCLYEGKHELPPNVRVHSLGKEHGNVSRLRYAWRFLRLIWSLRREYDCVLVHMNQEYLLIAGWLWLLFGKRIYLWRNHYAGSWLTDIAAFFCVNVFCTSKYSYTAKYAKTLLMPVGVDTTLYKPVRAPQAGSVLFYARMSPSKRPDLLLDALAALKTEGVEYTADFFGTPLSKDEVYLTMLKERVAGFSNISFYPGRPPHDSPEIFSAHEVYVDPSRSGMFNKAMFEAAGCGALVLASSRDWAMLVPPELSFAEGNPNDLCAKLKALLALPQTRKHELRAALQKVVRDNSLDTLITELYKKMA